VNALIPSLKVSGLQKYGNQNNICTDSEVVMLLVQVLNIPDGGVGFDSMSP
jgi:hypothetical protein